jgi:hypothetical protein
MSWPVRDGEIIRRADLGELKNQRKVKKTRLDDRVKNVSPNLSMVPSTDFAVHPLVMEMKRNCP